MNMRTTPLFFICLLLMALPAAAQWAPDGAIFHSGNDVVNDQSIVPDGQGGGYFVEKVFGLAPSVQIKKFDVHGRVVWTEILDLPAAISEAAWPLALPDRAGGVYVVFAGFNGSHNALYVNRYDAEGNLLLGRGLLVSGSTPVYSPTAAVDDGGAVFLGWRTALMGGDHYGQKVAWGSVRWNANGVKVNDLNTVTSEPMLVPDGNGGACFAWQDRRSGNTDLFAQRIDNTGSRAWTTRGVEVCGDPTDQYYPTLVEDGLGGCLVFWYDVRNSHEVYGQRIDSNGAAVWTADGNSLAMSTAMMTALAAVSDGQGGALAFWRDFSGSDTDIYGQGVSAEGSFTWVYPPGLPVFDHAGDSAAPQAVSDGQGGAYIVCGDTRSGEYDIYVQRVNIGGGRMLEWDGLALCAAVDDQTEPRTSQDGSGGLLACWKDYRDGLDGAYGQHLDADGNWGYPGAMIEAVADVPGDQGGAVNLAFHASYLDVFPGNPITSYTIWRTLSPTKAAGIGGPVLASAADFRTGMEPPVYLAGSAAEKTVFWELMSVEDPYGLPAYARILPTPYDSTGTYAEPIAYRVITHTADPTVAWPSAITHGLSVDNLAPAVPLGLSGAGSYDPVGLSLSWLPNGEEDLARYALYRGPTPDFPLEGTYLVAQTTGTEHFDPDFAAGDHYRLAAIDVHGNMGGTALLAPGQISAAPGLPGPRFALHQNVPNPFNPSTLLAFELPRASAVRLGVYDISGRLVRLLLDAEAFGPGTQRVRWDGRDEAGRAAAAGVYFGRLEAAGEISSIRMALVK
ncbi:MAG: FlgD immunoglobulin-like domain containing protein [bacterium]